MATKHQHAGQTVIDPVCGTNVDPQTALAAEHDGQTFSFCSNHCRTRFLEQPDTFLGPKPSLHTHEGGSCCHGGALHSGEAQTSSPPVARGKYTCPMHSEMVQDQPGDCPKCGMALERSGPPVSAKTIYTCPMHPEVEQDHPGTCPKCGMALEPKTLSIRGAEDEDDGNSST
jgi:Cu+-exporting ATPase